MIILSSPPVLPPVPVAPFVGMTLEWQVGDRVWPIDDWRSGVLLIADPPPEGMDDPKVTRFTRQSRAFHGQRSRGMRIEPRECFWQVLVYGETSVEWATRYADFKRTVQPGARGVWRVRSISGGVRELVIESTPDGTGSQTHDPQLKGWSLHSIPFVADQPFWVGPTLSVGPWAGGSSAPFFPGPPFHLSRAQRLGSATVDNPGDVETYVKWVVVGPLAGVELGVGSRIIDVPFDVADGQVLVIDTDPRNVSARQGTPSQMLDDDGNLKPGGGSDMTEQLGFQDFAPVRAGGSVPVHVTGTGTGSIEARLTPLYFRAY